MVGVAERSERLKKVLALLLLVILAASLSVAAGCGNDKKTVETEEGKITVEETGEEGQGGTITFEGDKGQTTVEVGEEKIPTEEELGAPIYEGAEYVTGSGVASNINAGEGQVAVTAAEYTTKDGIKKVVDWYKGKMGDPMINTPEETTWLSRDESGQITSVSVKVEEGAVKITIEKVSGNLDVSP
jgi:hypothetical protein